jgi:hypothetical protein
MIPNFGVLKYKENNLSYFWIFDIGNWSYVYLIKKIKYFENILHLTLVYI